MIDEAGRQTPDQLLLEDVQHDSQRNHRENGSSRDNAERAEFAAAQCLQADRYRATFRPVGDQERPEILSSGSEERDDGERANRRPSDRYDDVTVKRPGLRGGSDVFVGRPGHLGGRRQLL